MKNLADKRRAEKKEEEEARVVASLLLNSGLRTLTCYSMGTIKKEGSFGEDYYKVIWIIFIQVISPYLLSVMLWICSRPHIEVHV